MEKGQASSVKGNRSVEDRNRAIFGIPKNWMAMVRKLHAQLMRPTRLRPEFEQCQTARRAPALKVQKRLPGFGRIRGNHVDTAFFLILAQPIFQAAGQTGDL